MRRRPKLAKTTEHERQLLNTLAAKAGMPADFDFALRARSAMDAFYFVRDAELLDQKIRKQKAIVARVARGGAGFAKGIDALDQSVLAAIACRDVDMLPGDIAGLPPEVFAEESTQALTAFAAQVSRLSAAARGLLLDLPRVARGPAAEAGLRFAIKELHFVYTDQFPGDKGIYRDTASKFGYGGKFYHLVRLLLSAIGIQKSPLAVGKAIERSLKA